MEGPIRKGRKPKGYPEFLCPRMDLLRRIFAYAIDREDWVQMHRPMTTPYDKTEESERCREHAEILKRLPYTEVATRCNPEDAAGYPARILQWQYKEGLLRERTHLAKDDAQDFSALKPVRDVVEFRSQYARRLSVYLVAQDANMAEEYLVKLCRKYDLHLAGQLDEKSMLE